MWVPSLWFWCSAPRRLPRGIDGKPVSLGLLEIAEDGEGYILLDQHVTEDEPVFVTIEPAGGSPTPTGAKVVWTED